MTGLIAAAAILQVAQSDLPTGASVPFYELMTATKFPFKLSSSKVAYSVVCSVGTRRQLVLVNNKSVAFSGDEYVQIYSSIWAGDAAPSEEIMKKVFPESKKLGAFYLTKFQDGKWGLRFNVKFRVTDIKAGEIKVTDTDQLKDSILFVASVADEMEAKLGPGDIY